LGNNRICIDFLTFASLKNRLAANYSGAIVAKPFGLIITTLSLFLNILYHQLLALSRAEC